MSSDIMKFVQNLSEQECLGVAVYFYNIYYDMMELDKGCSYEKLFKALIIRFNKEQKVEKFIRAFIDFYIDEKDSNFSLYEDIFNITDEENFFEELIQYIDIDENFVLRLIAHICFFDDDKIELTKKKNQILDSAIINEILNDVSPIDFITEQFNLSKEESKLLLLIYRLNNISEFKDFYVSLLVNVYDSISIFSKAILCPFKQVKNLLNKDKKLRSFSFFDFNYDMNKELIDCISAGSFDTIQDNFLKEEKFEQVFDAESFSIASDKFELALNFLTGDLPANILLYGAPGAGKTEFAKTLASKTGLKIFSFKNEIEIKDNLEEGSVVYRLNFLLSIRRKDSIIIVDEAENILESVNLFDSMSSSKYEKGIVNKMLENNVNKVIWILNDTASFDKSTLCRFNYSIEFNPMSKSMIQNIVFSKLKILDIQEDLMQDLLSLCDKYKVYGYFIDNLIRTIQFSQASNKSKEKLLLDVENVLEANSRLVHGNLRRHKIIQNTYDISVLNTSISSSEIISMVKNAVAYSQNHEVNNGIRMLFYGLSGTGKTEFARYISEVLDKKLIIKKASDILNAFVGESEMRIKDAFD